MSSIEITVIVADLNKQERTHRFSPSTRVRDVRSHYPHYGTGVFLYYCMVKMDADKSLWHYELQNGCKVEFRMEHPVIRVCASLKNFLAGGKKEKNSEMNELQSQFLKRHPKGYLDKWEFYDDYFADLFTDKRICDAVFDLYDLNKDGKIDDKEWMYATSTLVAGPEKLGVIFSFYDAESRGNITRDRLLQMFNPMYSFFDATDKSKDLSDDEDTPQKLVGKIYKRLDKTEDQNISLDEFKRGYDVCEGMFEL